ncbi:MAG: hypothetical protein KAU21_05840 [Gammaproteobacteria bacterium]|nr:hypothetical protein [Gammaproteobacteria bacterium]
MFHFIACHAPDIHGAKVADGLARVSMASKSPHLAFKSKELAQYYLDCRNAAKLCYIVSEDLLSDTIWFDFSDGILLFKSIKEIRKSLKDVEYVLELNQLAYRPILEAVEAF